MVGGEAFHRYHALHAAFQGHKDPEPGDPGDHAVKALSHLVRLKGLAAFTPQAARQASERELAAQDRKSVV